MIFSNFFKTATKKARIISLLHRFLLSNIAAYYAVLKPDDMLYKFDWVQAGRKEVTESEEPKK